MYRFDFLTDETINDRLADTLDSSLSMDASYQKLIDVRRGAADAVADLNLSRRQWKIINEYANAITDCLTVYSTAAYRLGFKDGVTSIDSSIYNFSNYLDDAEKVLDALKNGTVPISWHAQNHPKLARTVAVALAEIIKEH